MIRPNDRCLEHMRQLEKDLDVLARIGDERAMLFRAMALAAGGGDIATLTNTKRVLLEVLARENARTNIVVDALNAIAKMDPLAWADAVRDVPPPAPPKGVTIQLVDLNAQNAPHIIAGLGIVECRAIIEMHGPRCNDGPACKIVDIARDRIRALGGVP